MTLSLGSYETRELPAQGLQTESGIDEDEQLMSFIAQLECECRDDRHSLPDPIEVLKKVMKSRGLTNRDLKPYIGSSGNVCDILKKRRHLSLAMIRRLHSGLGIPARILIQEYPRKGS